MEDSAISNEIGYSAQEISKQSVDEVALFRPPVCSKMLKEKDTLKKELLYRREPELEDLETSQPIYIAKKEKACFEEHIRTVAGLSLNKECHLLL